MTSSARWEQPARPHRRFALPLWAQVALPLAAGLTPGVALLAGAVALPPVLAGVAAAAGLTWALRKARARGGPWIGFVVPAEATFVPHDPEFGARLSEDLELDGYEFQNIVASRSGRWRWTFVEAVRPGERQRLVVIGFDQPLPSLAAQLRFRDRRGTEPLFMAIREANLPGTVVGHTGNYTFATSLPGRNIPFVMTRIVTPELTAALEQLDAFGSWRTAGHQLVGYYDREELLQQLSYRSIKRAGEHLAAVAEALAGPLQADPEPEPAPETWPTL